MLRTALPFRLLARLSLVAAALLHFVGVAGGPWAHTHGLGPAAVATVCAPDSHGPHTPAPHDELGCGVWQVHGAVGIPVAGAAPAAEPPARPRTAAAPPSRAPSILPEAPSARAPPVA